MATWLSAPLARVRAIVEGAYPSVAVSGRSVTAGRFRRATYRGDIADPGWPGTGFHRHYLLATESVSDVAGAAANWRTGRVLKRVVLELRVGYLVSPDATIERAGVCPDEDAATQLAHEDAHELEEALRWPDFWAGTDPAIAQVRPAGDATATVVIPRARVLLTTRWDVTVDFAPGQVWA